MTFEIAIVLVLLVAAIVLFATEKYPVDLVALGIMTLLMLSGIITGQEGISGFSNMATVTVGAMFVLSTGLFKTGAVNYLGTALTRLGKNSLPTAVLTMMLTVGIISAFINNTAAVAIFMPIVLGLARDTRVSASKLLMPLSFASMFGGVCTLIGTSTNILVSAIVVQHRQPAFSMFEFAPLGLIMMAAGTLYMMTVGVRLIPNRRSPGDLTQTFGMGDYLTEVVLLPEAESVGKTLRDSPLVHDLDLDVLTLYRGKHPLQLPGGETVLAANDLLRIRCNVEKIKQLQQREGVALKSGLKWRDEVLESEDVVLVEGVIAPNSPLEGKSLKQVGFRNTYGATALAILHHGEIMHERLGTAPLRSGDVLLIEVRRDRLDQLKQNQTFVFVSEVGLPEFRRHKMLPALAIILGVVAAATLNILPIMVSAIVGCILLVLTGCVTLDEARQSVEWKVIFLLAGVLPLGIAMEKSGAALLLSNTIIKGVGEWGPVAIMSALFLLTTLLTNVMSNNATAALLAPIAIATAQSLNLNARPFLIAITFAASLSFMTPIGYQTNTLIYGPGQYRFADFLRVGTPLNLLFWILATLLIPRFWPF
ncbi:MAG: SLC13 family permease [Blastocatellia bacterium]|nr:SLC13 family permease [Blastocatellia bacterium]